MIIIISGLVLVTVVLFLLAVFGRRKTPQDVLASRLEAFKNDPTGAAAAAAEGKEESAFKQRRSYSGIPLLSAFFGSMKGSENIATFLEQAGIPLRVGEYYMIRWACAFSFFIAPFVFGFEVFNLIIAGVLGVVGYMLPRQWVSGRRKKRQDHINAQLVDMLGMVSNSLKSGYGLMQSFEFAGRQLPDPLGLEIRRMLREATLGMTAEQALAALGMRMDSRDMDMVLTAINIQRAVGGNLAEILDKVAFTMRERTRIRGEINTLTAQQKMTGVVIGALPIFMFIVFMIINPDYMSLLFTTTAGRIMMLVGAGMEVLGYITINRIMAIEI
jgi:tight adherence protein B